MSTSPSNMKTIAVSEATNHQLDWLVAIALGWADVKITAYEEPGSPEEAFFRPGKVVDGVEVCGSGLRWKPTSDWAQGGPIFSALGISAIRQVEEPSRWVSEYSQGCARTDHARQWGATELIAKARCLIVSRLGDMVEVPVVFG